VGGRRPGPCREVLPLGASTLTEETGPVVTPTNVTFLLDDPDEIFEDVRLYQEIERPRSGPPLKRANGAWELTWPRPPADRIEYMFEVRGADDTALIQDPQNPRSADGPFGPKSVIEFPGYQPPDWIAVEPDARGTIAELPLTSRMLRHTFPARVWTAPGLDEGVVAPVLVVHDGPEYAGYSLLTHFLDVMVVAGEIPPLRAILIPPVNRNEIYSGSARYARTFAHELLPGIVAALPVPHGRGARIGMGASLGALSMLHIHRTAPATFGGLYLQSGSFFRQRYDPQESGFIRFRRITRFTGRVLNSAEWEHPIPIAMTCGQAEENLKNNRAIFDALKLQGYELTFHTQPDAHNWTAWRDSFHPSLVELINRVWQ
jgi:enterochelin esterase-like enzyme